MCGMQFPRNHRLYDIIDRKTRQLFTGGITNFYAEEFFKVLNADRYEHLYREGPKVLTMKHLEAGFVTWLVTICFATFVFFCEWINKFREYLGFQHLMTVFYKQRRGNLRSQNSAPVNAKRQNHSKFLTVRPAEDSVEEVKTKINLAAAKVKENE